MKRLTAALAALALPASALIAEAADLPRRPPDPPPMPMPVIFSWAGPYVGIHGAYGWGEFNRYTFDQNLIAAAIPANYQYANVARAYAQSLPGTYDSHQWGGGSFLPVIILLPEMSCSAANLITPPSSENLAQARSVIIPTRTLASFCPAQMESR